MERGRTYTWLSLVDLHAARMKISEDPEDLDKMGKSVGVCVLGEGAWFCACDEHRTAVVVEMGPEAESFLRTDRLFVFYRFGEVLGFLPHLPAHITDVARRGQIAKHAFGGTDVELPNWVFYMGLPTMDNAVHLRYAAVEAFIPICLHMQRIRAI